LFSFEGRVAVVTGATGTLGTAIARGLGDAGARVVVLARHPDRVSAASEALREVGVDAVGCVADVVDVQSLRAARDSLAEPWRSVDILVTCAGGNLPAATVPAEAALSELPVGAFRSVVDLNLLGTLLPVLVFGESMQVAPPGRDRSIVTVSSMAAERALTRVGGYGVAKAAVESLTRWLAVEWARRGSGIRVNAIAPGFFVAEQNRALLYEQDGSLTERGAAILAHTPAGRFGNPEDVISTVIWLCSPGSRFVTGTVVPIDGGFSAYGGV